MENIFAELIKFSWTLIAFIFAVQGWLFLQEFKGNRILKARHTFLGISIFLNVIGAFALMYLFNAILDTALSESKNFVSEPIKFARAITSYSTLLAFISLVVSVIVWLIFRNKREEQCTQST
jgi:hypothetical protein